MKTKLEHCVKVSFLVMLLSLSVAQVSASSFSEAQSVVRATVDNLIASIGDLKRLYEKDKKQYHDHIKKTILPVVAMDLSARFILGSHWKSSTKEQRDQFTKVLQHMLIDTYGKTILGLENAKTEYLPENSSKNPDKKQIISTRLRIAGGGGIRVDYIIVKQEGQWKILDLVIDGFSMIKQLRGGFSKEIEEKGLQQLITRLQSI